MNDRTVVAQLVTGTVKELLARKTKNAEEARIAGEILVKDIDSLRELILEGKATTGDRITDYCIAMYKALDDTEISKPLREVQNQMTGKKGQLFLVVQYKSERHTFGGPNMTLGGRDYHLETQYSIGLLSGEELFLDRYYGLPAEKYAVLAFNGGLNEKHGPFLFLDVALHQFGRTLQVGFYSGANVEVYIGDEEVLNYLPHHSAFSIDRTSWIVLRNRMARMVGKDVPEAPEEVAVREGAIRKFRVELNVIHNRLINRLTFSPEDRKKLDEKERNELSDKVLSGAREFGIEADLLVQLVLKEIRETPA